MDQLPVDPPHSDIAALARSAVSYVTLVHSADAVTNSRRVTVALYLIQQTFAVRAVSTTEVRRLQAEECVYSPAAYHEVDALWIAVRRGWVRPVRRAGRRRGKFQATVWTITAEGIGAVEARFADDPPPRSGTFTSAWNEEQAAFGR